eukprot:scaffold297004_cov13-Prasinocladus_malaysianus.AAC.1
MPCRQTGRTLALNFMCAAAGQVTYYGFNARLLTIIMNSSPGIVSLENPGPASSVGPFKFFNISVYDVWHHVVKDINFVHIQLSS